MFRRRRPLARAAIVGGTAYAVGKHVQGNRDQEQQEAYDTGQADAAPPARARVTSTTSSSGSQT